MAEFNVDVVTIENEEDLEQPVSLFGTFIHLTLGRKSPFEVFASQVLSILTGGVVRTLLQALEGDDRLHVSAIRGIDGVGGGGAVTTFPFPVTSGTTINVPGMTENPQYVAVYVERDRYYPSEFTTTTDTITFNTPLQSERGLVDFTA